MRALPATTVRSAASTMVSSPAAAFAAGSTFAGATPGRKAPIVIVTR
jgi:hypothetical protein